MLSAKGKNRATSSIHLRVDEFVGKTNGEAFQLNKRKCKKLKTIFSNSEDALEAISDHKVFLSSLNIQIFEMECACCSDVKIVLSARNWSARRSRIGPLYITYTAISRKVVGKSARDNLERYCGWFWVLCFSKKFERIGTKGHGNVFASAKGKQQK